MCARQAFDEEHKKPAASDMTPAAAYVSAIKIRSCAVFRNSAASPARRVAAESEEIPTRVQFSP